MSKLSYEQKMDIIEKYQKKGAPIHVVPIAHEMGINVYKAEYGDDNISGNIVREDGNEGDSGYAIYVNKNHSYERRRFTIAHELAHFILHEDKIGDGIFDDALYRSGLSNKLEVEANKLAADILMPFSLLVPKIEGGIININKLAKEFEVSTQAMSIRLGVPQ